MLGSPPCPAIGSAPYPSRDPAPQSPERRPAGYLMAGCNGPSAGRFWGVMDTDSSPARRTSPATSTAAFEALVLAHQDRCYSIALRMLGDPARPRRRPRTPSCGPTGHWRATTPARIRELRLRAWLATIVLNLCRTRLGAAGGARAAPPLSLDLDAGPARCPSRSRPTRRRRRRPSPTARAEHERWAGLLADPAAGVPGRRRPPPRRRPVLSRARRSPSTDPRAPSRPRSTAAWPCCAPRSRPPSASSARR